MNNEIIKELLSRYQTPMYVFDSSVLRKRVAYLRRNLPDNVSLCYAVKANTFIMKELEGSVERFEVCSPGELSICRELGIPMEKIIFSGVYKTPSVIEELMEEKASIGIYTIESMVHYRLLKENAKKNNLNIKVMPRLTSGNQFGMGEDEVKQVIRELKDEELFDVVGIHFFSGTQKTSMKKQRRELEYVKGFLQNLKDELDYEPKELEFGPGFPVAYFMGEEFDEDEYLKSFSELLEEMDFKTKVTLELGRSIAASCGTYLTGVVDMKTNKGQNYAIIDGGINQLVYFGQSMAMKHPVFEVYPERSEGDINDWNICGSLCTVNDIIVKQLPVQALKEQDVLVFKNTGAYCMTEGISLFLSRDLPTVVLIDEDIDGDTDAKADVNVDSNISEKLKYQLVREHVPTYLLNRPVYKK